ncbi:hypothetical protein KBT16_30760 [Nostoc sp. CCCryo 231-06]|uniref:hypothetical protein n=1 Tax=Nostoc commune TaxID=1178 RepID=UPI0018C5A273|nr:hypothetical protein [Nostoc commune]MCL6755119.1 hypothetical protein [Nostoc sp. CCCryo 231-06]
MTGLQTQFFGEFKQTRFYQEVFAEGKEEGKLETITQLWALGLVINLGCEQE